MRTGYYILQILSRGDASSDAKQTLVTLWTVRVDATAHLGSLLGVTDNFLHRAHDEDFIPVYVYMLRILFSLVTQFSLIRTNLSLGSDIL